MSIVADQARFQLFSPLSAEKYAALKEDIRKNGVLVPVELDQNGEVLDGHHRIRIWEELRNEGLPVADYPRVVREFSSDDDREEHAAKINSNRRDISTEDKQRIALRWRQRGWSYRRIADALGVGVATAHRWIPEAESTVPDGTVALPERVIGMDGKSRPATMPKPATPDSGVEERYIDAGTGEILPLHYVRSYVCMMQKLYPTESLLEHRHWKEIMAKNRGLGSGWMTYGWAVPLSGLERYCEATEASITSIDTPQHLHQRTGGRLLINGKEVAA